MCRMKCRVHWSFIVFICLNGFSWVEYCSVCLALSVTRMWLVETKFRARSWFCFFILLEQVSQGISVLSLLWLTVVCLCSEYLLREVFLRALEHSDVEPSQWPRVGLFFMGWIYSVGQPEKADVQLRDEMMIKTNGERNDEELKQWGIN